MRKHSCILTSQYYIPLLSKIIITLHVEPLALNPRGKPLTNKTQPEYLLESENCFSFAQKILNIVCSGSEKNIWGGGSKPEIGLIFILVFVATEKVMRYFYALIILWGPGTLNVF